MRAKKRGIPEVDQLLESMELLSELFFCVYFRCNIT